MSDQNPNVEAVRDAMGNAERIEPVPGNVSHIRKDKRTLQPQAQELLSKMEHAADIRANLERRYVIKGVLDHGGTSMLFGPSNTGKSFLALDMAHHVAKGLPWFGRKVRKGRVLYVAAEGGAAFNNRVAALEAPEFWVLNTPFTLAGQGNQAGALSAAIQHLTATGGAPFDLIVFDTLSRVMGHLHENAAPAIAELIGRVDQLRRATGAHVMLIHRTGKEVSKGARGHSALRAAIDTEIHLTRDDDVDETTAELTKQRDGVKGGKFRFHLNPVTLGQDEDGDRVTSCVVAPHLEAKET